MFMLSGKRGNDYYHFILPMMTLRADAAARTLLEDADRRLPPVDRLQEMLAFLDLLEGKPERSIARIKALAARVPDDEEVKGNRADVAFLANAPDLEAALEPLMQYSASNSGFVVAESVRLRYGYTLGKRGESAKAASLVAEADRIAREKIAAGNETPGLRIELAAAAVLRKDTNGALEWLARAHDACYRDYGFLERDPILAELRATPRFHDIIDRMRKDVEAQRARAQERGLLELDGLLAPGK